MQNFLKRSLFTLSLFSASCMLSDNAELRAMLPPGTPPPLPSVAEVFGGLSEQEIAQQVQMGQQFLEDLQKNGTPQEIAEFQKLLETTLNSMSEDDFKDIQAIAQMVEPHLNIPQENIEPVQTQPAAPVETKDTSVGVNELDEFKKLVNTITQRIDDIFQKIHSSKECAELLDAKWKNKSTFMNMKRQIHQLRHDRLAQKLCKKDLKEDDKKLVDTLQDYLKDLTKHNDALVIEDDFGLPASHTQEQKHLKQTKAFVESCDDYIDKLMPLLEKFLQKWDPEALQIAKETEARVKKAAKEAVDATVRKPSPDVRVPSATPSRGYNPAAQGAGYQDYGSGYYPEGYGQYGQSGFPSEGQSSGQTSSDTSGASGATTPKSEAKSEIAANAPAAKGKDKDKNKLFDYAMDELQGHIDDDFPLQHETAFVDFMNKQITNYPDYILANTSTSVLQATQPGLTPGSTAKNTTGQFPDLEQQWIYSQPPFPKTLGDGTIVHGFKDYADNILTSLNPYVLEFKPLHSTLQNLKTNLVDMPEDVLKKIPTAAPLTTIERRLKRYQDAFSNILPQLANWFNHNTTPGTAADPGGTNTMVAGITTPTNVQQYQTAHDTFVRYLTDNINNEIEDLLTKIKSIKRSAKRHAGKKAS
ncbi:hypothetical protein A3J41_01635 [candidate division TM6 bacterium RIFCSPHIGHO2_12_FULL_38_8]|nr:MAG: hypothetical protein A3J41_01635 [candidate division TM6 bacterium RIFCSPHIGHO2_12_FULL_38_8]